jgi:hypothetical protein
MATVLSQKWLNIDRPDKPWIPQKGGEAGLSAKHK